MLLISFCSSRNGRKISYRYLNRNDTPPCSTSDKISAYSDVLQAFWFVSVKSSRYSRFSRYIFNRSRWASLPQWKKEKKKRRRWRWRWQWKWEQKLKDEISVNKFIEQQTWREILGDEQCWEREEIRLKRDRRLSVEGSIPTNPTHRSNHFYCPTW